MRKILIILFLPFLMGGVDLDGTDDVLRDTTKTYESDSQGTVYIRFKTDAAFINGLLFCLADSNEDDDYFCAGTRDSEKFRIQVLQNGTYDYIKDTVSTFGAGEHSLIWTQDGTSAKCYIDGSLQSMTDVLTENDATGWFDDITGAEWGEFGRLGRGSPVGYYDNVIIEGAVWSNDLTAAEASLLHNAKLRYTVLQIQPTALQAYWTLDSVTDGTNADSTNFIDHSGNGNTMVGDDGANNSGCTAKAEDVMSYP